MGFNNSQSARFEICKGILYLYHSNRISVITKHLMLANALRNKVISLGHDTIMSGHLGIACTCNRIRANSYWLGL